MLPGFSKAGGGKLVYCGLNECIIIIFFLQSITKSMTKVEFANSKEADSVAENEPPHLGLYCFPSGL